MFCLRANAGVPTKPGLGSFSSAEERRGRKPWETRLMGGEHGHWLRVFVPVTRQVPFAFKETAGLLLARTSVSSIAEA